MLEVAVASGMLAAWCRGSLVLRRGRHVVTLQLRPYPWVYIQEACR